MMHWSFVMLDNRANEIAPYPFVLYVGIDQS